MWFKATNRIHYFYNLKCQNDACFRIVSFPPTGKTPLCLKLKIAFKINLMMPKLGEKYRLFMQPVLAKVIHAYNPRQETRVFPCRASVYTGASSMSLQTTNTTTAKHKWCLTCKEVHCDPGEDSYNSTWMKMSALVEAWEIVTADNKLNMLCFVRLMLK